MFWIVPAWVLSLIAVFFLGFYLRGIHKKIETLEQTVKMKVDKKPEPEESKSTVIDVLDPIQQAKWEHDRMMKELNGE